MKMKDNCISNKYYVTFPVTSQLGDYYVIIQCSNFSKCTEIARKYFNNILGVYDESRWTLYSKPLANKLLCELKDE